MDIINAVFGWLIDAVIAVLQLLPESPIQKIASYEGAKDIIGYLNWFIPVGMMVNTMGAVLAASLVWYGVRWVLRFSKYVE